MAETKRKNANCLQRWENDSLICRNMKETIHAVHRTQMDLLPKLYMIRIISNADERIIMRTR